MFAILFAVATPLLLVALLVGSEWLDRAVTAHRPLEAGVGRRSTRRHR